MIGEVEEEPDHDGDLGDDLPVVVDVTVPLAGSETAMETMPMRMSSDAQAMPMSAAKAASRETPPA